jgi:hypothetical protein
MDPQKEGKNLVKEAEQAKEQVRKKASYERAGD